MAKRKISGQGAVAVNPFKLDALEVERLRVQLAKRANQRLVRLERRRSESGEMLSEIGVAQYAYSQIKQIRHIESTKSGKLRFRESPVKDVTSARQELFALQSFLNQETSKAGTAARYVSKTEKTLREAGITAAKNKSFYNFLNSSAFTALKETLSSDDIVEIYNKAYESGNSHKKVQQIMTQYLAEREAAGKTPDIKSLSKELGVKPITGRGEGNKAWRSYKSRRNKARRKASK